MVARSGRCFGRPFKGYQGMTQGNLLYPIILNMVVDAVIRHWVTVMAPTEAGMGVLCLTIIDLAAYLYADNGLVASTQPERLQRVFDVLTGFFDQVGLCKIAGKTVGMVCQPCHAPGGILEESYKIRTTGIGETFWERQRRRVECLECGVEVAEGLLLTHCQIHNGV